MRTELWDVIVGTLIVNAGLVEEREAVISIGRVLMECLSRQKGSLANNATASEPMQQGEAWESQGREGIRELPEMLQEFRQTKPRDLGEGPRRGSAAILPRCYARRLAPSGCAEKMF